MSTYQQGYAAGRRRRIRDEADARAEIGSLRNFMLAITLHSGLTPDQIIDAVLKAAREGDVIYSPYLPRETKRIYGGNANANPAGPAAPA